MDSLLTEIVSSYSNVLYASKPELAARRIEAIGYHVGHQLSERYTMERPRFSDHLEAIKFICKDFWSELFKKQIDNLKTNHRGTFVLQDDKFAWLSRMSVAPSAETSGSAQEPGNKAAEVTGMHLYFPCGIIRGALSNLGIPCAVSADISNLPALSGLAIPRFVCDPDKGVVSVEVSCSAIKAQHVPFSHAKEMVPSPYATNLLLSLGMFLPMKAVKKVLCDKRMKGSTLTCSQLWRRLYRVFDVALAVVVSN
ncbi:trafficking protein particle complex subunit 6B-like protein [Tanacetum coccineum]